MSASTPATTLSPTREADRREDVALLAVDVVEQREPRRAVRIVLDRRHPRRHVVLVATEIDDTIAPLVAAAAMARGDATAVVAAAATCGAARAALGSGLSRVISAKSKPVRKRRPGDVGL